MSTKKEQAALLRAALTRLHFHFTITENKAAQNKVLNTLMGLVTELERAESIDNAKEQDKIIAQAYQSLKDIP